MSFYKKYELDRLMADGDAKTFRAAENATGRPVFLHLFNPSGQPLLAILQARLKDRGKSAAPLIEIGEFAGAQYAVTEAIDPFTNLRDWMETNIVNAGSGALVKEDSSPALAPAESVAPRPPVPLVDDFAGPARTAAPPASRDLVDDFAAPARAATPSGGLVDDFGTPARSVTSPMPAVPSVSSGLVDDFAAPARAATPPDFGTPPRAATPPAIPAGPPSSRDLVDDFAAPPRAATPSRRLVDDFGTPARAATPPAPTAPPRGLADQGPGEFTRFFQNPSEPAPPSEPAAPAGGLVDDGPGEFTRLFGQPQTKPPAPPKASSPAPGEFTRQFEFPGAQEPVRPSAPPARIASGSDLTAEGPGEFTRIFQNSPGDPLPPKIEPRMAPGAVFQAPADPLPPPPMPRASAHSPTSERPPLWPPPSPHDDSPETGQFTRLFGSRLPGEDIDIEKEHASAARSAPPENRPFQAAGEFTRMFGPEGVAGQNTPAQQGPQPAVNAHTVLTSASGMFGDPNELAKIAAEALGEGKPGDTPPGDYTRSFASPFLSEEPAKQQVPAASVPEATVRKSNRDFIILGVVGGLVLVALIVLVVILLKR